MTAPSLLVSWQQALVEEVVLRAITGHPDERPFRRARNKLYVVPEDQRDHAFGEFHATWFERLGLGGPINGALAELPLLAAACARCVVTRAATRQDEGADMLVASDAEGAAARTVLIRLCVSSFDDADNLLATLRAELLHVADMVDPTFGYQPALPPTDGGPSYERLLRDRYRALWDVSVAGRLARRGVVGTQAEAHACGAFMVAFPMLSGEVVDATFHRFFSGAAHTHADLVAFAAAPRGEQAAERLAPGGRCPLCRFPTYAPEPTPEALPEPVVQCILADFPAWRSDNGLCSQCADLYRSRPLSMRAVALLPHG
jgi:hypothetical protein